MALLGTCPGDFTTFRLRVPASARVVQCCVLRQRPRVLGLCVSGSSAWASSTRQSGNQEASANRWLALAVVLSFAIPPQQAQANDAARAENETPEAIAPAARGNTYEIWAGADATRRYASIWTGLTWSPFGSIQDSGWRLRGVTGGGRYSYDGWRIVGGLPQPAHFKALTLFGDALVGYHLQIGSLTLKPFAGISMVEHRALPFDPVSRINGRTVGAKLALDTWWAHQGP